LLCSRLFAWANAGLGLGSSGFGCFAIFGAASFFTTLLGGSAAFFVGFFSGFPMAIAGVSGAGSEDGNQGEESNLFHTDQWFCGWKNEW
jgi:hypothetical protein